MEPKPEVLGGSLDGHTMPGSAHLEKGGAPVAYVFFDQILPSDTVTIEYYQRDVNGQYRLVMDRSAVRGEDWSHGG